MYRAPKNISAKHRLYQIFGIILLCILLAVLSFNITLSWFVDESVTSNGKPNILVVGTVDLNVETNFNFYNLVLAPDTIYTENIEDGKTVDYATKLYTSNKNNTGTIYVRVEFTTNRTELNLYFDENLLTTASPETNYVKSRDENKWVYDGSKYYYYLGEVGSYEFNQATINSPEIVFNSGYIVDNTLDNSKANADVEINFVFESIQRPYGAYSAVWEDAPAIFDTFAQINSGY